MVNLPHPDITRTVQANGWWWKKPTAVLHFNTLCNPSWTVLVHYLHYRIIWMQQLCWTIVMVALQFFSRLIQLQLVFTSVNVDCHHCLCWLWFISPAAASPAFQQPGPAMHQANAALTQGGLMQSLHISKAHWPGLQGLRASTLSPVWYPLEVPTGGVSVNCLTNWFVLPGSSHLWPARMTVKLLLKPQTFLHQHSLTEEVCTS